MENDSMIPLKHKEVDIPDFLKKPQETRVTITESVLQESMRHEYYKWINSSFRISVTNF